MHTMLTQVADRGAPAQAARARELLAMLRHDPQDETAAAAASALVEAFLHDPYLERFPAAD